jgi:hypothetical protein
MGLRETRDPAGELQSTIRLRRSVQSDDDSTRRPVVAVLTDEQHRPVGVMHDVLRNPVGEEFLDDAELPPADHDETRAH